MAENPMQPKEIDKKQKGLKEKLVEMYRLKLTLKNLNKKYDDLKNSTFKEVKTYMDHNGNDSLMFTFKDKDSESSEIATKNIRVMNVVRRRIIFNPDALEERLGKEFCREFISRQYQIIDWDGMVKLLKSKGITPKEFLPFIKVEKQVNSSKIEQMESLGDISREELEGTYTVQELANFLQLDELNTK